MKSLYIAFLLLEKGSGISRKIMAQYEALKYNGLDIDFCVQKIVEGDLCYVINDTEVLDNLGKGRIANARSFFRYNKLYEYIKRNGVKILYLRYALNATPSFVLFLKKVRKLGTKIYMEIPTFPYDGELFGEGLKHKMEVFIESISRRCFFKYVDKVITFSLDEEILGIPTIKISNAVDSSKIRVRELKQHEGINMIAVAMFNFWHGYDRLIKGLYHYYSNHNVQVMNKVHLYIVGKGTVLEDYKKMVRDYGIEEYVTFCGVLYGEELDKMFDISDVGIGSLGRHRNNITQLKALKNVEYAVRGIPFIYSENNPDFDDKPYIKKVSADDSDINIKEIISFVQNNSVTPKEERNSVVDFLSWKAQMKKVVESM